jgi:hypothetical protein
MYDNLELGMVVHACNSTLRRPRQENQEFEASLGYLVKPYLKNKQTKKQ